MNRKGTCLVLGGGGGFEICGGFFVGGVPDVGVWGYLAWSGLFLCESVRLGGFRWKS